MRSSSYNQQYVVYNCYVYIDIICMAGLLTVTTQLYLFYNSMHPFQIHVYIQIFYLYPFYFLNASIDGSVWSANRILITLRSSDVIISR